MTTPPVLAIEAACGVDEYLPHAPIDLVLPEGDFALIEVPGPRRGASFANLCAGLIQPTSGCVRFLDRDWQTVPDDHADALRGHIGRLFHQPLRSETRDVASRVLLARLHHTRIPEAALREEAAALALRFGLPGLPVGPARLLSPSDLRRAACVRAFLGKPRLVILELPLAAQHEDMLSALLDAGTEARGQGAAVVWLANAGPALRNRAVRPTHRLRLTDATLMPVRLPVRVA